MANLKIYKFDHVDISLVSVHNLMGETADKDTVDTHLFPLSADSPIRRIAGNLQVVQVSLSPILSSAFYNSKRYK